MDAVNRTQAILARPPSAVDIIERLTNDLLKLSGSWESSAREIDEARYVLVILPALCIISIYFSKFVSKKILDNKKIFVVLIILVLILSLVFVEIKKRDKNHDYESYLVSEKIIELTDKTNRFYNGGYIKSAILISEWPNLPKAGDNGKLILEDSTLGGEKIIIEFLI